MISVKLNNSIILCSNMDERGSFLNKQCIFLVEICAALWLYMIGCSKVVSIDILQKSSNARQYRIRLAEDIEE